MSRFFVAFFLFLSPFVLGLTAPPVMAQTQKTPVAVLELRTKGSAEASEGNLLTDRIRSLVVRSRQYDVMERALVDKILREQGFQSSQSCEGNESCSVRIGQLLAVREIITGSLNKVGDFYSLTLRRIDVERGIILKENFYDCQCSVQRIVTSALPQFMQDFLSDEALTSVDESDSPEQTPLREKLDPALGENIRTRKPFLFLLNAGTYPYAALTFQYNFNDYFAIYGGGGLGRDGVFNDPGGFGAVPSGFFEPVTEFPSADAMIGTKVYFMTGTWSPYMDLSFSVLGWGEALAGIEYRHETGFTATVSGGWAQRFFGANSPGFAIQGGLGYAF